MTDNSNTKLQERINELEKKVEQSTHQLEKLSSKLLVAESQRSSFLSNILNEINNPLTSILGLTNNIKRMVYSNPELVHKQANLVFEQAFELDYKMKNIFAAAAIEAGSVEIKAGKIEVIGMLHEIIQDLHFKSKRKTLTIQKVQEIDGEFYFLTDPNLLRAIILNLVGNAIEFSPQGASIKINLQIDDEYIVFTIVDQGDGISEKDQKLIFSRFKQLDEGVTKSHQGTGLGLSIVKEYTELLGGTLQLNSSEGSGSTFVLTLPCIADHSDTFEEVSFSDEELF